MSRTSIATPCPAPYALSNLPRVDRGRRSSTTSLGSVQDDTEEIDYTRAIQADFKKLKPRRKPTFQYREKNKAAITIFEDVLEDQELVVEESRPQIGGHTLLGKRAQRLPARAMPRKQDAILETSEQEPLQAVAQVRRRPSIMPQATVPQHEPESPQRVEEFVNGASAERVSKEGLKKEPRRRTIFVPSDDTTMLTIHPGANTTDRLNDTFQLPNFESRPPVAREEIHYTEAPRATQPVKRARMSLAAAPRRVPLQQVLSLEINVPEFDVAGQNGGKENMPPNAATIYKPEKVVEAAGMSNYSKGSLAPSSLLEPTAASRARQSVVPRRAVPYSKPPKAVRRPLINPERPAQQEKAEGMAGSRPERQSIMSHSVSKYHITPAVDAVSDESKLKTSRPRPKPMERKVARLQQYPVLSEDIAQPELYEDSWLGHQEVALTELVNQIFTRAEPEPKEWQLPKQSLRDGLIAIYHQPNVATLHKRLHASLLYGALSRPRDGPKPPDPACDIGLRKRFLGFWLKSYDQESLRAAAEVVFGRQLPEQRSRGSNEGTLDPHKGRRTLIGFLDTFLVEVEDVEEPDEQRGDDSHAPWRKMVLRSFMLIWLLDRAKRQQAVHGCLFKAGSFHKTSVSMLHGLASMLIPSVGDVTRVLRHLDYEVSHVQDPLSEVRYHIDNIAIDLRDGILMTRLVELLLFTPKAFPTSCNAVDATITVQMPDLTVLESALYDTGGAECSRILSQHLKMPCLGRALKVYNVEVAISALHSHGRIREGALDVTADDIVDGHREKTLSLLWSLVSNHGLEQLVDFRELIADIRRAATHDAVHVETLPEDYKGLSQLQQESLLQTWALTYSARNDVRIGNLNTSFADGKAYAAILAAFTDTMAAKSAPYSSSPKSHQARLEAQLHAFGCSTTFIKQLTSACGTIPSRKTTISNLAFLASRLLPLARQHSAAIVVQRAIRLRKCRRILSQRIALMRLAHACATVVQTQNRLVSAATILQRAWRNVLDVRIKRLDRDVERFQAAARSWALRKSLQCTMSGLASKGQSLRVMGGW